MQLEEEPGPENQYGCAEEMVEGFPRINIPTVISNGPDSCEVYVNTTLTIVSKLTIESGAVIKFGLNGRIRVEDGGVLEILGSDEEPVFLEGAESVTGYWNGIRAFNARLVMQHVFVSDAGQPAGVNTFRESGIYAYQSDVDFQHVTVSNSANYGIYLDDFTRINQFENNTLKGNGLYGLVVVANQVHLLDTVSDYAGIGEPNLEEGILVIDGIVDERTQAPIWQALNTHYVSQSIRVQATTLTLDPGVEIWFEGSLATLFIEQSGGIVANGTLEQPVILRGLLAEPGAWRGISLFSAASQLNEISHLELLYAGSESDGAISLFGANLTISNSRIAESQSWGIACTTTSQLTIGENVVFSDNAEGDVQSTCGD